LRRPRQGLRLDYPFIVPPMYRIYD
jgi:hypothetical protein